MVKILGEQYRCEKLSNRISLTCVGALKHAHTPKHVPLRMERGRGNRWCRMQPTVSVFYTQTRILLQTSLPSIITAPDFHFIQTCVQCQLYCISSLYLQFELLEIFLYQLRCKYIFLQFLQLSTSRHAQIIISKIVGLFLTLLETFKIS